MIIKDFNNINYVELFNFRYFEIIYKGNFSNIPDEYKNSKVLNYKIYDDKLYAVIED